MVHINLLFIQEKNEKLKKRQEKNSWIRGWYDAF